MNVVIPTVLKTNSFQPLENWDWWCLDILCNLPSGTDLRPLEAWMEKQLAGHGAAPVAAHMDNAATRVAIRQHISRPEFMKQTRNDISKAILRTYEKNPQTPAMVFYFDVDLNRIGTFYASSNPEKPIEGIKWKDSSSSESVNWEEEDFGPNISIIENMDRETEREAVQYSWVILMSACQSAYSELLTSDLKGRKFRFGAAQHDHERYFDLVPWPR